MPLCDSWSCFVLGLVCFVALPVPVATQQLNEIVLLGSHNSFHLIDEDPLIPEWRYEHPPVAEQAETYGMRQFEFDILDYVPTPMASIPSPTMPPAPTSPPTSSPANFPDQAPNVDDFAVGHLPGFDNNSSCTSLRTCSQELRAWSLDNRSHLPLFIYLQITVVPASTDEWNALNDIIEDIWGDDLLTPAELRGERQSLRETLIVNNGWPNVDDVRGQVLYLLDNEDYLNEVSSPSAFVLFSITDEEDNDNNVFVQIGDARRNLEAVNDRASRGWMIRSRSDTPEEYVVPTPTNTELLETYFSVLDQDDDSVVTFEEVVAFTEATGFVLDEQTRDGIETLITGCSGSTNFTQDDAVCIRDTARFAGERLPPRSTDFASLEEIEDRRDQNLASGSHMISTDHFIPGKTSSGGFVVTFGTCEFYLNPTSDACRNLPQDIPEECTVLCPQDQDDGSSACSQHGNNIKVVTAFLASVVVLAV